MDRTSIGNFHQPRPLGFGHIARDDDFSSNLTDICDLPSSDNWPAPIGPYEAQYSKTGMLVATP